MNKFQNITLTIITIFCFYSFGNAQNEVQFIVSMGMAKPLNYETVKSSKANYATSIGIGKIYNENKNKGFSTYAQILYNYKIIKTEKFSESYVSRIRNLSLTGWGGVYYQSESKFDGYALLGFGIHGYKENNSNKKYFGFFNDGSLDSKLGLDYNVSNGFKMGLVTEYGLTNRQKPYQRVDKTGNIFVQKGGLNPITLSFNLAVKL